MPTTAPTESPTVIPTTDSPTSTPTGRPTAGDIAPPAPCHSDFGAETTLERCCGQGPAGANFFVREKAGICPESTPHCSGYTKPNDYGVCETGTI